MDGKTTTTDTKQPIIVPVSGMHCAACVSKVKQTS